MSGARPKLYVFDPDRLHSREYDPSYHVRIMVPYKLAPRYLRKFGNADTDCEGTRGARGNVTLGTLIAGDAAEMYELAYRTYQVLGLGVPLCFNTRVEAETMAVPL